MIKEKIFSEQTEFKFKSKIPIFLSPAKIPAKNRFPDFQR